MSEALLSTPPVRWQDAKIVARKVQTAAIASFFLQPSQEISWRAGQHVDVRLTAEDGYRAIRSYSIASAPGTQPIELAIERLPDGEVSPFFHDVAAVGDVIELKGPLGGHFVWESSEGGPLLLAGGGSGLVPLMAMVRHRAATGSKAPFQLLLSARTWDDILYRDELLDLARREDGFGVAFAITRERPRRAEDFGRRVDVVMMAAALARLPGPPKRMFVCGTNGFVNAAGSAAEASGVAARLIHTERYGGL